MITEDYIFRPSKLSDIEHLQKLGPTSYGQLKSALTQENWQIMEANLLKQDTYLKLLEISTGFVCEYKNEIIGMVFLVPSGNPTSFFQNDWAYIRLLGVHPDYGGRGIGRKLMQMCIDLAKETDEQTLALHTSEFQDTARHIYESMGFKILRSLDNKFDKKFWLYTLSLNDITYHKASLNDMQTLIDFRVDFLLEITGNQSNESISNLKKELETYYLRELNKSYIVYLAKSGDAIVGIGGMTLRQHPGNFKNPTGKIGYILNMYTLPAYRRKGICSNILELLIKEGTEAGISSFELHATKEGEFVYQKYGFKIHHEPTYRKYTD